MKKTKGKLGVQKRVLLRSSSAEPRISMTRLMRDYFTWQCDRSMEVIGTDANLGTEGGRPMIEIGFETRALS